MRVYVATKNEKKIALTRKLIRELLPYDVEVLGCLARSEVSDTPWDEETHQGARNRAINSLRENSDADIGIGIETGLTERYQQISEETWCCIVNKKGQDFCGYASGNIILNDIKKRVIENRETGTKTLEIFDAKARSWVSYSGNPNIREICLSNAIKEALIQFAEKSNGGIIK